MFRKPTILLITVHLFSQLAEQYGGDITHNVLRHTRSNSLLGGGGGGGNDDNAVITPLGFPEDDFPMDSFKSSSMSAQPLYRAF